MRVLIPSSYTLLGEGLVMLLGNLHSQQPLECEVIGLESALVRAQTWVPDLIVVEAVTDFAQGLAVTRELRELLPDTRLVILSTDDDEATVYEVMNAGADGFLTRNTSPAVLLETLRGVLRGEVGLPRTAALRVIHQLRRTANARHGMVQVEIGDKLTPREHEVFELVREGLRSREIAEALCIAEGTVYKHIHNILEKLNVHSRNRAVVIAVQDAGDNHRPSAVALSAPEHVEPAGNSRTSSRPRRRASRGQALLDIGG